VCISVNWAKDVETTANESKKRMIFFIVKEFKFFHGKITKKAVTKGNGFSQLIQTYAKW